MKIICKRKVKQGKKMKIICAKNIMSGAVTPALSAVSAKATVKGTDGLLLTADKNTGTLIICGYDMEKGVKVTVSGEGIQVAESGKIIVNAERFSSVIKNLPDGNISITVDSNFIMTIKSGKSNFTLNGLDGTAFPMLPELKGEKNLKLSRKVMKSMIASTLFSVSNNNFRLALNGASFEIQKNQLNVVSSDGNRLSIRRSFEGLSSSEELDLKFIIPGKSLYELMKLINDDEKPAEIELTQKHVIISFDNIIFFSRLIEQEFLDYKRVLNINPKTTIIVNTRSFQECVERAALLTDAKQTSQVRLSFTKEEINIANDENIGILKITTAGTLGKSCDECDIEIHGDDITIGFNQRYLFEALKAVKEEKIIIKLESSLKSALILPYEKDTDKEDADINSSKYLYLLLPMRMKEEESVKKAS